MTNSIFHNNRGNKKAKEIRLADVTFHLVSVHFYLLNEKEEIFFSFLTKWKKEIKHSRQLICSCCLFIFLFSFSALQAQVILPKEIQATLNTEQLCEGIIMLDTDSQTLQLDIYLRNADGKLLYHSRFDTMHLYKGPNSYTAAAGMKLIQGDTALQRFCNKWNFLPPASYQVSYRLSDSQGEVLHNLQKNFSASSGLSLSVHGKDTLYIRCEQLQKYKPLCLLRVQGLTQKNGQALQDTLTQLFFVPAHYAQKKNKEQAFQLSLIDENFTLYETISCSYPKLYCSCSHPAFYYNDSSRQNKVSALPIPPVPDIKPPTLRFSGSLGIEQVYSNAVFKDQYTLPVFTRFYLNPTLEVAGVPLSSSMSFSTENNQSYPVNSFNLGFDAMTYKNKYQQQVNTDLDKLEQDMALRQDGIKSKQAELNTRKNKQAELLQKRKKLQAEKDSLQLGSVPGHDSLPQTNMLAYYTAQIDALDKGIDTLQRMQKTLETSIEFDSLELQNRRIENSDSLRNKLKHLEKNQRLNRFLLSLDKFNIGIFYPQLSSLTIQNIPVRGLQTGFVFSRFYLEAIYGNTINGTLHISPNLQSQARFSRQVKAVKIGLGQKDTKEVSFSICHFNDRLKNNAADYGLSYVPRENLVLALGGKWQLRKNILATAELARSFLHEQQPVPAQNIPGQDKSYAMEISAGWSPFQHTELKASFKSLASTYCSLGLPFARNDYREQVYQLNQQLLKSKIQLSFFYKHNRDNLRQQKSHTSTMQGYGASLRTAFYRCPNVMISYSPYEMASVYNPDPRYPNNPLPDISNRVSVFTARIYHRYRIGHAQFNSSLSYNSNSYTESNGESRALTSYATSHTALFLNKITLSHNLGMYEARPYRDSVRTLSHESSIGYQGKKMRSSVGFSGQSTKPLRSKHGFFLQAGSSLGSFDINLRCGMNFYQGEWYLNTRRETYASLLVLYNFSLPVNKK